MYACMHVCIYACMHVCMCAYMHVCMYAYMHVGIYLCMYVCMYVCIYVCMFVFMQICKYFCRFVYTYVFTKMCLKTPKGLEGPLSPLQKLEGWACCAHSSSFISYEIPAQKFMPKFNLFSMIRDKYSSSFCRQQASENILPFQKVRK